MTQLLWVNDTPVNGKCFVVAKIGKHKNVGEEFLDVVDDSFGMSEVVVGRLRPDIVGGVVASQQDVVKRLGYLDNYNLHGILLS